MLYQKRIHFIITHAATRSFSCWNHLAKWGQRCPVLICEIIHGGYNDSKVYHQEIESSNLNYTLHKLELPPRVRCVCTGACALRDRAVGDPENDVITVAVICHSRVLHTGKSHSSKRQWISITLGEFSRVGGCDINNLRRAGVARAKRKIALVRHKISSLRELNGKMHIGWPAYGRRARGRETHHLDVHDTAGAHIGM